MLEVLEAILVFFISVFLTVFDIIRCANKYYCYREKKAYKNMLKKHPQLKRMDD